MKFYVTHRFHLIKSRLDGLALPDVIERTILYDATDLEELSSFCGKYLGRIVKQGGVVADNPLCVGQAPPLYLPNVTKELANFDIGIFIPGHMIAWVETITTIKPRQHEDDEETEMPIQ